MNASNGVWSDTQILQIITQQQLQTLITNFQRLDFEGIKFPVTIKDIQKIEKGNSIGINVFGYENKEKYPIYASKQCCEEKHVDSILIGEEGARNYALIKDFSTFMYDHTIHRGRKKFYRCCLQAFSTEEILKSHIKVCFKIKDKQRIMMSKKLNMLNSKIMKEK